MNCLGEAIKHMILKKDQPKWTNHKNTGFEINWSKQTTHGWTNWTQDFEKVDQNEPFMDEPIKNYKIFFMNSAILKIHLISMVKIKK
jgi:hypothetical protein